MSKDRDTQGTPIPSTENPLPGDGAGYRVRTDDIQLGKVSADGAAAPPSAPPAGDRARRVYVVPALEAETLKGYARLPMMAVAGRTPEDLIHAVWERMAAAMRFDIDTVEMLGSDGKFSAVPLVPDDTAAAPAPLGGVPRDPMAEHERTCAACMEAITTDDRCEVGLGIAYDLQTAAEAEVSEMSAAAPAPRGEVPYPRCLDHDSDDPTHLCPRPGEVERDSLNPTGMRAPAPVLATWERHRDGSRCEEPETCTQPHVRFEATEIPGDWSEPRVHTLKSWPEHFEEVRCGRKAFEVRKDDRPFHVGDTLRLCEWWDDVWSGRELEVRIGFIMRGPTSWGFPAGWCVLGLEQDNLLRRISTEIGTQLVRLQEACTRYLVGPGQMRKRELLEAVAATMSEVRAANLRGEWLHLAAKANEDTLPGGEPFVTVYSEPAKGGNS